MQEIANNIGLLSVRLDKDKKKVLEVEKRMHAKRKGKGLDKKDENHH